MNDTLEDRRSAQPVDIRVISFDAPRNAYECKVVLCPEEEGGFSIICLNLPGVASQGEDEKEALDNIQEAFRGAILAYQARNEPIPWASIEEMNVEAEALRGTNRWIVVDV